MKNILLLLGLLCSLHIVAQKDTTQTIANDKSPMFVDELDGQMDISNFLMSKAGFLPVPIIITNPAVGYGGAMAALFIHSSLEESKGFPTISGLVGGGTQNGTWMTGLFHMQSFFDNKIRYVGFLGYADINMRFYGLGYTDYFKNNPTTFTYSAPMLMQKVQGQLGDSKFYAGVRYMLMNNDIGLDPMPSNEIISGIIDLLLPEYYISQLSFVLTYDKRDNFFSPSKGIKGEFSWNYSDQWLGADNTYHSINSYITGFTPVGFIKNLNAGLRLEYGAAFEGTPFFLQPGVNNRGVAFMRYQDKYMLEAETELSYAVNKRWDVLGFVGLGDAYGTGNNTFFNNDVAVSGGAGFRYLIARKFGIKMGPDFSYNEQFSFMLVMGHAWNRD